MFELLKNFYIQYIPITIQNYINNFYINFINPINTHTAVSQNDIEMGEGESFIYNIATQTEFISSNASTQTEDYHFQHFSWINYESDSEIL